MPTPAVGYGAKAAKAPLERIEFTRRDLKDNDVSIKIAYCGVCHSDLHTVRDEWGGTRFPLIPGHEIAGHVTAVGAAVTKFKVGDAVGVGCIIDSCRECEYCHEGKEQFCATRVGTYNGNLPEGVSQGGYSDHVVVREECVLRIPASISLEAAAPLLCAGITTYSPLRHWGTKAGDRVGVVGLGGLGHMAVKLAAAMGAEVTVFTTSESKREDAARLGAKAVVVSGDAEQMATVAGRLHLIIHTVGVSMDLAPYLQCLRADGSMVLVGLPESPHKPLSPGHLIRGRRSLAGSPIGGIPETQEMLDFCAEHKVYPDTEVIKMDYINDAYERMLKNDVKYRFVIDISSLQ